MATDAILKRLLALHPNKLIDLKLDRIERLLNDLGNPENNLPPIIHVAGTNGKGSTIAFLRAMLEAAGKKVHIYTSPHLVKFNERIRLAGKLVSSRKLNKALEHCEKINDGKPITYFEITTACAFHLFAKEKADFTLIEVGLGGRFDATNVIKNPFGTIITPISLDHMEFLGTKIAQIAKEKAGIIKKNTPLIVGKQEKEALFSIIEEAKKFAICPFIFQRDYDCYQQNGRLIYQDEEGLLDLPAPSLRGEFQFENAAIAIAALRHCKLSVSEEQIAKGLANAVWPARFMPIREGKLYNILDKNQQLWLDGGHNEAGGKALALSLSKIKGKDKKITLILGAYKNKDIKGFLRHFKGIVDEIIAIPLKGDRASLTPAELIKIANMFGHAKQARSIKSALKIAAQNKNNIIVICGSLHLAGDFLRQNGGNFIKSIA